MYLQGVKIPFLQLFNRFCTDFVEKVGKQLIWKGILLSAGTTENTHFCALTNIAFFCSAGINLKHILDRILRRYCCFIEGLCPIMNMFHFVATIYKHHVQGNIGVFHPEKTHIITAIDKKHT